MTCEGLGRHEEAKRLHGRLLELLPNYVLQNPDDSRARMFHAVMLAEVGQKDAALREGSQALEVSPGDPMMLYNCACLYSRLGEAQRAIEALRQAIAGGYGDLGWIAHDSDFDSLRENAEFKALIAQR